MPVFAAQCIQNLVPIGEPAPPPEEVDVCGPCLLRAEQENAEMNIEGKKETTPTPEERALVNRIFDNAITPNAEQILLIGLAEARIVVVVFEPSEDWAKTLAGWGWQGEPVFGMPLRVCRSFACRSPGDREKQWFDIEMRSIEDPIRIFLVYQATTSMMSCDLSSFLCLRPREHDSRDFSIGASARFIDGGLRCLDEPRSGDAKN